MLRKVLPILGILFIAAAILIISLYQMTVSSRPSFAAASLKFSISPAADASPSPQKTNYYLVYPGMLPDHPLYKIKMMRDQIWLSLTSDLLKKSELLLLFADKRMGAGEVLINGNKIDLGMSTLTKGTKYFERAVNETNKAKNKGKNTAQIKDKLKNASLRYEDILVELKKKVSADGETYLEDLLKQIRNLRENSLTSV